MSLTKFITDMLNIEPDQIEKLDSIKQSDDSIIQRIRLKHDEHIRCSYCHGKVKIQGYSSREVITQKYLKKFLKVVNSKKSTKLK